jgi:hypothetical protein
MTTKNGVLQHEVCQHWISLTGGKRDHFSAKYKKSMFSEGPLFLQNIENQCCHCDFWLH